MSLYNENIGLYNDNLMEESKFRARTGRPLRLRDQLRVPSVAMVVDMVKEAMKLPEGFCGACTLREGITFFLIYFQSVCVLFCLVATGIIVFFPHKGNQFWYTKFYEDFDPYFQVENHELINRLWPLWYDFTLLLIGVHGTYFFTGLMAIHALRNKEASIYWYLPWLGMTLLLAGATILLGCTLFVINIIIYQYREITVTWDLTPMILVFLYGYFWGYGFTVSWAHYKRRCIVKYWRESQRKLGNL